MLILGVILFLASLLTMLSLFFARLATFQDRPGRINVASPGHPQLSDYLLSKIRLAARWLWHFILEAKDLKPATTKTIQESVQKVKNVFRIRIRSSEEDPHWLPEATQLSVKPLESQNPEELYLAAIRKNPDDKAAYESLGRLYLQNKNYVDASQTFEYLAKLDPSRDIYFSNLGLSYYMLNDYQKAVLSYERALNMNKRVPTRWINLSLCFIAMEEHAKAVKALLAAIELDKFNVSYMMMLADEYLKIPNRIRAEEVLEQILNQDPTNRAAREKLMRLKI